MSNITNEKVTSYIEGFYKPLMPELSEIRAYGEENHVPIIFKDSETFLMSLVLALRPVQILEIGTAIGYSAACFAAALPNAKITSLELSEEMCKKAIINIENLGFSERIKIVQGDAEESLNILCNDRNKGKPELLEGFDFVFIDAAKSHYRRFLELSMQLIAPKATIVCDNVLLKARTASDEYDISRKHRTNTRNMREFLDYLTAIEGTYTSIVPIGDGVSITTFI